jgi:hypothetical protein
MADESLLDIVERLIARYYPGLLPVVKSGLAVFGAMALEGRTKPLSVIFETTSGYGKSAVTQMFFPFDGSELEEYAYRCDKFTPKSFVSHAANVSKEKLLEIDLLPQLKSKVLITKELAPIFRGREDELKETFSILIAVLDGKGFSSNSGVQGKRGYEEDIVFNWLGATTPLPKDTHRLMYNLGTRLLFYEVPSVPPSIDALSAYAKRDDTSAAEVECRAAVNHFIVDFFKRFPLGGIPQPCIEIPNDHSDAIARWAELLAVGRRAIVYEREGNKYTPVSAATPEGPYKIVDYFKELARGHAMIHERTEVNAEDIALVEHIAISSMPAHLRPIVRALQRSGKISSAECERICRVTRPTARRYLLEASLLELGTLRKGDAAANASDLLTLSPRFRWLRKP